MSFGVHSAPVIFQLVSFGLLLVSTITAPATKLLSLAEAENIRFGTLGYCSLDSSVNPSIWSCSKAAANYNVQDLAASITDWSMDYEARKTLSKILIVIPVACFFQLLTFVLAIFSHIIISKMMLIIELIFLVFAFLLAALVCIVSLLLFYPHPTYGSWILIPAAVWPLVSIVFVIIALLFFDSNSDDESNNEIGHNALSNNVSDEKAKLFDSNNIDFQSPTAPLIVPPIEDRFVKKDKENVTVSSFNTYGKTTTDPSESLNMDYKDYPNNKSNQSLNYQNDSQYNHDNIYMNQQEPIHTYAQQPHQQQLSQPQSFADPGISSNPSSSYPEYYQTPSGNYSHNNNNNLYSNAQDFSSASNNNNYNNNNYNNNNYVENYNNKTNENTRVNGNPSYGQQSVFQPQNIGTSDTNYLSYSAAYDDVEQLNSRPVDQFEGVSSNSDFTSVSQRPPNLNYYSNQQEQGYATYKGYAPPPQNQQYMQQRQTGPSKSEMLLNSNPEFSLGSSGMRPKTGFKRKPGAPRKPGNINISAAASLAGDSPYNIA